MSTTEAVTADQQQAIEEAEIDIQKAERTRTAKAFEIHSALRKALVARRAAFELLQSATGKALPMAKSNFDAFRAAQQTGHHEASPPAYPSSARPSN